MTMASINESHANSDADSDTDSEDTAPGNPPRYTLASGRYDVGILTVLYEFLDGQLDSQPAAEFLACEVQRASAEDEDGMEGALGSLWRIVIECAIEQPNLHSQLAALLKQFASMPLDGQAIGTENYTYGSRFDLFDGEFFEEWQYVSIPAEAGTRRDNCLARWFNVNRFAAHLLNEQIETLDLDRYVIATFTDALEEPSYSKPARRTLDIELPAAAAWVEIAGGLIFKYESPITPGEHKPPGMKGSLWTGRDGYCRDRWNLWKQRFEEIAVQPDVTETTQIAASKAARSMTDIERAIA